MFIISQKAEPHVLKQSIIFSFPIWSDQTFTYQIHIGIWIYLMTLFYLNDLAVKSQGDRKCFKAQLHFRHKGIQTSINFPSTKLFLNYVYMFLF